MRRWHPDKFLQKLGERIVEEEKEEVNDIDVDVYDIDDYGKFNDDYYDIYVFILAHSLMIRI